MTGNMKNDLDLPLLPSAEQIRRREFATVRRGYDPDQVREYLQGVASQVETLERELRERRAAPPPPSPGEALAAKVTALEAATPAPPQADPYGDIAKRFAGVLETADREATAAISEAKAEATKIVEEARAEADRIKLDAQARAEAAKQEGTDTLQNAKRESDRILGSLAERRASLVAQMHDMQTRLLSVAKDLEASIEDPSDAPAAPPAGAAPEDEDVDPRYEDMWAIPRGKAMVDIPDLASLDVDFDEERRTD
jgi:cell division initiation protein